MKTYDCAVILGHQYTRFGFSSRHIKRITKALDLYHLRQVKYLIPTGGKGLTFNRTHTPLAIWTKDYLVKMGVPEKDIIPADKTFTTWDDASDSLKLMQSRHLKSAIVVTSADHMLRAKPIFELVTQNKVRLDYVISDYFSGFWSFFDFLCSLLAWPQFFYRRGTGNF